MSDSLLIGASSILLLLIIGVVFLYVHMQNLKKDMHNFWQDMNEKILTRTDMVPQLIEVVRMYSKDFEPLIQEIVSLRNKSWMLNEVSAEKVQTELSLSSDLKQFWAFAKKDKDLSKDSNFLFIKKRINDLGLEIDQMTEIYNQKVRHFNGLAKWMHFQKKPIFEFEV